MTSEIDSNWVAWAKERIDTLDAEVAELRGVARRVVEIFRPMQDAGKNGHTFELLLHRAERVLNRKGKKMSVAEMIHSLRESGGKDWDEVEDVEALLDRGCDECKSYRDVAEQVTREKEQILSALRELADFSISDPDRSAERTAAARKRAYYVLKRFGG